MGITLRNVKGTALTHTELDDNFIFLSQSYIFPSSSNSTSSSYSDFSISSSYASGSTSSSYALTASYALNTSIDTSLFVYSCNNFANNNILS